MLHSSGSDSSPCPSSPDYNDSPPYNHPTLRQAATLAPFKGWLSMAPQLDDPIPVTAAQDSTSSSFPSIIQDNNNNNNKQQTKAVGYSYKPPTPRKAVFSVGSDDEEEDSMDSRCRTIGDNNNHSSGEGEGEGDVMMSDKEGPMQSVSSVVQVSYPGSQKPPAPLAFLSLNGDTVDDGDQKIVHRPRASYSDEDSSDRGTTYDDSPPEFDVRSSFAPIPKYGVGVGLSFQPLAPQTEDKNPPVTGLHSTSSSNPHRSHSSSHQKRSKSSKYEVSPGGFIKINGGGGLTHGKREYRGLTAHAVEQEMEEIGDEAVMSHAPDPVYLASRLEGLRRNLEEEEKSPGGRRGGWVEWVGDEEESVSKDVEMVDDFNPSSNIEIKVNDEELTEVERRRKEDQEKEEEERRLKKLPASPAPTAASNLFLGGNTGSELSSTLPSSTLNKIESLNPIMERTFTSDSIASIIPPSPSKEAKMKALDERLEIRNIKRTDLEQIRELHCYHGDGEKHDTEAYTTSAPFLLRLLVDEKHVCLVAVEKPLPEPVALPNREDLSTSISSLDQRIQEEDSPVAVEFSQESRSPAKERHDQQAQGPDLSDASPSLSPTSAIRINSEPSSGNASANSFSETPSSSSEAFSTTDSRFSFLRNNYHTQGVSHYNPRSDRYRTVHAGLDAIKNGLQRSEFTAATSIGCGDTDEMCGAPTSKSMATVRDPAEIEMNLVGPTYNEDIAPPRTIKVMGLPPPNGLRATSEAENVLAVASATIGLKENNENMWANHLDESAMEFEAHILTLSISPAERSQGLGKKMLECLMKECKRRANEASSRASSANRKNSSSPPPKMRTYLEVHASNKKAINLYKEVGFKQMEGNEGVKKNFFRGDNRIAMSERMRKGGQDAIVMELID